MNLNIARHVLVPAFGTMACCIANIGYSTTITATVTADNHYALYHGTDSNLTFVGRNEKGPDGNPGDYNWSVPEVYSDLFLGDDERFYIVQWDESSSQFAAGGQGLLAEFVFDNALALRTNTLQWLFYETLIPNPGTYGDPPTADGLENIIASAYWATPGFSVQNGTTWAPISGISFEAYWIGRNSIQDSSYYLTVYRSVPMGDVTTNATGSVPAPATFALMTIGLAGLGFSRRQSARSALSTRPRT